MSWMDVGASRVARVGACFWRQLELRGLGTSGGSCRGGSSERGLRGLRWWGWVWLVLEPVLQVVGWLFFWGLVSGRSGDVWSGLGFYGVGVMAYVYFRQVMKGVGGSWGEYQGVGSYPGVRLTDVMLSRVLVEQVGLVGFGWMIGVLISIGVVGGGGSWLEVGLVVVGAWGGLTLLGCFFGGLLVLGGVLGYGVAVGSVLGFCGRVLYWGSGVFYSVGWMRGVLGEWGGVLVGWPIGWWADAVRCVGGFEGVLTVGGFGVGVCGELEGAWVLDVGVVGLVWWNVVWVGVLCLVVGCVCERLLRARGWRW